MVGYRHLLCNWVSRSEPA